MKRICLLIITLLILSFQGLRAQSVGLVLSGGGAKGLYHIGVIRALEENGIPIDYISGTSIGSIIGGFYAAGYSPEQMEEIFTSDQIKYWLTGRIEPRYTYYFKQMQRNAAMFTLRFDVRGDNKRSFGPGFPTHLLQTDQLDMASVEFFASATVACQGDFDSLMIPFRCVATDAMNRRAKVFAGGDLGTAIRSSMSIPLVYSPVRRDSTIYYDGGMFDNFPWRALRDDFSPDIIIGIKCLGEYDNPDEKNAIDQIFSLTMLHTDYNLPGEEDILIERVFSNVSTMDFDKARYVIEQGYIDGLSRIHEIKAVVGRTVTESEISLKRQIFAERKPPLVFSEYNITGLNNKQQEYVRKLLRLDETNQAHSFDRFRSEYFKILAEGEIDGDYPKVTYDEFTGLFDLDINMTTKPSLKVMFGGNISSTALNQAYVGLEYKLISRSAHSFNLDGYFSSFYSSVSAGGRTDFFIRLPFYFQYGGSGNFYNYFRSNYGFLSKGNDLTYSKYRDHWGTASVGTPVGRHSVLNFRANAGINEYLYFQTTGHEDADTMDRTRFPFYGLKFELERSSLNHTLYPTRGIYQLMSVIYIQGKEEFRPGTSGKELLQSHSTDERYWFGVRFIREHYLPVRAVKWFSFGYMVDGVLTTHPSFSNSYATNISSPAFTPTPHSRIVYMKEFRSKSYIGAGLMPTFEFTSNLYLKINAYAFLPEKYSEVKEDIRQRLRYIFDANLVYQSFLGPVSLTVSQYDTRRNNWFLTFNFGYAIFNRKGLFY